MKTQFIIILALFIALASYSHGHYSPETTTHYAWSSHQAKSIADIYNISIEEVGEPVVLFREVK